MPTTDQKNSNKANQKRGSLTGEKAKKVKKKKKSKKSSTSKFDVKDSGNNLEIEGSGYQNEYADDSDESSPEIKSKSPVLPKLSTSEVYQEREITPRPLSTDSHSTHSSTNRHNDTKSSKSSYTKSKSSDSISAKLSNLSLKSKSSKTKSKSCQSAKKDSAKCRKSETDVKSISLTSSLQNITEAPKTSPPVNESIRWENKLENPDSERERIHLYKINRRKRYLAAAQMKGLGWVKQYGVNGFPLSEDSGMVDVWKENSAITDLSSVAMLRSSHSILGGEGKTLTLGH